MTPSSLALSSWKGDSPSNTPRSMDSASDSKQRRFAVSRHSRFAKQQITFFAPAMPVRLPPWSGKKTKNGSHCRLHPAVQISRMGGIRSLSRPSTLRPGGVDSHRDGGGRPAPRRFQQRIITSINGPSNWELSTQTHCPFSKGMTSPPVPPAVHGRLKYRTRGPSPPLSTTKPA